MKRIERHHLKDNELATTLAGISQAVETRRKQLIYAAAGLLAIVVVALGISTWRQREQSRGQELLADAMVALNARVVPAGAAGPEGDAPAAAQIGATGSFSTEEAKLNAAIPKLQAAADAAPSSQAGVTARYHLAGALAAVGRHADAITAFDEVARQAGATSFYGRMARLGRADAQVRAKQYDAAIAGLKELATSQTEDLPVDALLMEMGLAYRAKGDTAEAKKTLTQIVDEHPNSPYAPQARTELDSLSGS
jgi:tetratricopeptide (TPR) repeat protein